MAFIKLWELFVLCFCLLSDQNCVTHATYSDPYITVDRMVYDFNGHGEYIFLQTGITAVQIRADYMSPGNQDRTIIVAVAIKDDIRQFEAQLNRTSGDVTVYKAGVAVCSSNDSPPQGVPAYIMFPCGLSSTPPRPIRGVLVGTGKVSFGLKGFGSYVKSFTIQGGSAISITLDGLKSNVPHINLTGLAGGSVNGNMVARNGSLYAVTRPGDTFAFGESWRVFENESLFNYSLSSGDYFYYNNFSRPTFFEDYLTNLTQLFNLKGQHHSTADIEIFNQTCNETMVRDECLLAIARSDDVAAGEAVNINYRHERYLYDMKHNTPPYFTDEIPVLDVYLADNHSVILNLSNYVHDDNTGDTLTFLVETNVPKTDFTLDLVSGIFHWTVLPSLRILNGSIHITFTVRDRFNSTVVRDVNVNFCGCNKTSQCDKDQSDKCNCRGDKYVTGDYCEIRSDPCTVTTCFNQSLCNATNIKYDTGPCAPCPKGRYHELFGDTQLCHDIDECSFKYKGDHKCDVNSNCTNTDGSFICMCHHGYTLMSNGFQCADIDECNEGATCEQNAICRNTVGSYMCDCIAGYGRKDGGPCAKTEGVPFVLSAVWQISAGVNVKNPLDTPENRENIQQFLMKKMNVPGLLSLEIVNITITTIDKTERNAGSQQLSVVFILHLVSSIDKSTLQAMVSKQFDNTPPNMPQIRLEHSVPYIGIEKDGLCSVPGRTDCDPVSTECRDTNGTYACFCRNGFKRIYQMIRNICHASTEPPTAGASESTKTSPTSMLPMTTLRTIASHNTATGAMASNTTSSAATTLLHMTLKTPYDLSKGMRVEDAVTVKCTEFGWDVRVNMNTLRQLYPNANASNIYMGDNSCTGQETWNGYLHFNQGLKECTTYESIQHGESVYSNQLIYAQHDPTRPYIIRHFNWTINLECTMNKNKTTSGHLHNDHLPFDGSVHSVQGADQNDLNMTFYRDSQFSHQIEGNPLHVTVGADVYVKVFTMTSQKIRVHTCYTKPSIDSLAPQRYMLISNGCEVDPSTHILSQTIRETRFVFTEFEYTTNHEGLFVFCDVTFCNMNDSSDQCSQICIR